MKNAGVTTDGDAGVSFEVAFEEALAGTGDAGTGETDDTSTVENEGTGETGTGDEGAGETGAGEAGTGDAGGDESGKTDLSNANKDEGINRADVESIKKALEELKPKAEPPKTEPDKPTELPKTDAEWAKFEEDWPEVAQVIRKEREAIAKTVEEMVTKALEPFKQDLSGVVKKNEEDQIDRFVKEVQAVHPKAIEELPELLKWADAQPKHIAIGIKQVLETSTNPKDVIEIYNTFKGTKGETQTEQQDETAKNILKKLEVVNSRRTKPTFETSDPADFDGAFEQAVKQYSR